ncbi:hypothetical protein G7Y89_g10708 [Cudoniella acicularis]|uniref:Uncharacterized protein n=1 Tax=Cudoniella acicularis TaxID=354080 RepID=A0A8H4VYY6_9HELO|nr:hypothetical protein G7Y89_g10708 [Cudoniella acicularis]
MYSDEVSVVEEQAKGVVSYGRQLATVFHQFALTADRVPYGYEGAINILDATITTLNQIVALLKDETEGLKNCTQKLLFSSEGITYVKQLVSECAKTLARIEPIITDASLPRKEFRAKSKRDKKAAAKNGEPDVVYSSLKLDEKTLLEKVERMDYSLINISIEDCMDRLYDLQLHLLLVFQVVTVGHLSRDISNGTVDIKSIVAFHERVNRTAKLVGIKAAKVQRKPAISSDSDSLYSASDSDSDASSIACGRPKRIAIKPKGKQGPPPPLGRPLSRGPPPPPPSAGEIIKIIEETAPAKVPERPIANIDPPSYSESHKSTVSTASSTPTSSTLLGTIADTSNTSVSPTPSLDEKPEPTDATISPDDKKAIVAETSDEEETAKPMALEPRLFRSKSHGFGFKLKTLFRSKESLAAEMKKTLCDTDSHLMAFVIEGYRKRLIPHSAFHSLETTHMRTILSQLNDDAWYKTFTALNSTEHGALHRLMYPVVNGKTYERQVVVLKFLKQENKSSAWSSLLKQSTGGSSTVGQTRSFLAILREELVNGEPLVPNHDTKGHSESSSSKSSTTTTSTKSAIAPIVPAIRPPPLPSTTNTRRISDLNQFHPPPPRAPGHTGLLPPSQTPFPNQRTGVPPPPGIRAGPGTGSPPSGITSPPPNCCAIRISDITPLTDYEATLALTTYNEYTVRVCEAIQPDISRSWTRVASTLESAEKHVIQQRVEEFQNAGGSVIQAKMRLTDEQNDQVTRLMDELKTAERDQRFEWFWVEISLFDKDGEMIDHKLKGPDGSAGKATLMHLIAKRMPKPHCKPMELYNSLMRVPFPPPAAYRPQVQPPRLVPTGPPQIIKLTPRRRVRSRSSSDSSGSGSDSSSYSSDDSSVGHVRRRIRRLKERKGTGKTYRNRWDSSDSESESEVEDLMKIKVEIKKGDDVVKRLLELWTPQTEGKGKGKEVVG